MQPNILATPVTSPILLIALLFNFVYVNYCRPAEGLSDIREVVPDLIVKPVAPLLATSDKTICFASKVGALNDDDDVILFKFRSVVVVIVAFS